ncbi:hypothetical protein [Streptomyces sp. SID12501]|uniref:PH domain-containing protein n=1 Tax=Streptomyces sp. SID12501 TaxID=2706042 RepID=A0A6B3BVZ2_9ACTN|nr:hypothetical protein [Streptomyces sp. SID12501]NEC88535.1 hypothetical protein [Streptomyces sp. SID12501]
MTSLDPSAPVGDRNWRGSARLAAICALVFCALSLLVDWDAGSLTLPRALLWLTLSATVLVILLPPRVTAGPGRLTVSTLSRRHIVRTDSLVAVRQFGGVSSYLVLYDTHGGRLELDPRVLTANPLIWHELDTGFHRSVERGTLRQGTDVLEQLGHRIDMETMRAVLTASGLS